MTVDLVAAQSDALNLRQKLRSREREAEEALVENARAWGAYAESKDAMKEVREIWDLVDGILRERDNAQKVGIYYIYSFLSSIGTTHLFGLLCFVSRATL